jgi:hypothetical protein
MRYIEIPETPKIQGEDAILALKSYVKELQEEKGNTELSPKQTRAMIKLANGLISSIQTEIRAKSPNRNSKPQRLVSILKEAVAKSALENRSEQRHTTTVNSVFDSCYQSTSATLDVIQERNIPK